MLIDLTEAEVEFICERIDALSEEPEVASGLLKRIVEARKKDWHAVPIEKVVVDALNSAFDRDPEAIHTLLANRVPARGTLGDDPHFIIVPSPVLPGKYVLTLLGMLNGLLSIMNCTGVRPKFEIDPETDARQLVGFKLGKKGEYYG